MMQNEHFRNRRNRWYRIRPEFLTLLSSTAASFLIMQHIHRSLKKSRERTALFRGNFSSASLNSTSTGQSSPNKERIIVNAFV